MSTSGLCKTCGTFVAYLDRHKCPPVYRVVMEGFGYTDDDAIDVHANDFESAATKWAEEHDRDGDYDIVGRRSEPTVTVISPDGVRKRFSVHGETVPQYHASEIP